MKKQRGIFDSVNETEYSEYIKTGYFNDDDNVNPKIILYRILFLIVMTTSLVSLVL